MVRNGRDTTGDDVAAGARSLRIRSQRVAAVLALVVCVLAVGALGAAVAGTNRHGVKPRPNPVLTSESELPTSTAWRGNGHRVVLAFGGDVHFEGALGVRLADSPASALDGAVSTLLSGASVSMVNGIGDNAAQAFRPYRAVVEGQRIAIFAATQVLDADLASTWTATADQPGLASAYQPSELVAAVRAARRNSDTIVVYLHWGTETQQCPNARQEPLAAALVKAGADIVVGAHAHVPLGAGYLGTSLVDYGLGNFAFYDTTPPETDSGSLLVTATGRHIDHYQWRPAVIENGLPEPRHGEDAAAAVQGWNGLRACTNLSSRPHPTVSAGA